MRTKQNENNAPAGTRVLVAGVVSLALGAPSLATAQSAAEGAIIGRSTAPAQPAQSAPGRPAGGPMQMTISMNTAPPAAPVAPEGRGPNCTGALRNESTVVVSVGKSSLIPLPEAVKNRTLGNPAIVQATMVSPQTLYVLGRSVGTTNMIVQGRSGTCSVINVVVNVDAAGLQNSLTQLMPGESKIRVTTAADNLVLTGSVSNAQAAQQAMEIARVYASAAQAEGDKKTGGVLNMLAVDTPQQVMLEVKVAEVSKTLLNQMGAQLNLQGGFGTWSGGLASALLSGAASAIFASKANHRPFQVEVDAQKNDTLVKILAEPNLVTLSGQEASFLAGGKIFIPVVQSNTGTSATISLQEEEFGVGLKFTPTVMSNGRINLKVSPEVSELSPTGATVSATVQSGSNAQTVLPLITTRRATTTVQMRDGETFAIGGLLQDNARGAIQAIPGVGEVPVLGALFRSTSYQRDMTELVFVITPHLVQPMQTASIPLPTDSFTRTNELQVLMMGNMEGSPKRNNSGNGGNGQSPSPMPQAPAPSAPATPAAPSAPTVPAPGASSSREPEAAPPLTQLPPPATPVPRPELSAIPQGKPLDEPVVAGTATSPKPEAAAPLLQMPPPATPEAQPELSAMPEGKPLDEPIVTGAAAQPSQADKSQVE